MTKTTKISLNELYDIRTELFKIYEETGEFKNRYFLFNNRFFKIQPYDFICPDTKKQEAFNLVKYLTKIGNIDPNHVYVDLLDENEKVYYLTLEEHGTVTNYLHEYYIYHFEPKKIQSKKEIKKFEKLVNNNVDFDTLINEITTDNMIIFGTDFNIERAAMFSNNEKTTQDLIGNPFVTSLYPHPKFFTKEDIENTILENKPLMEKFGLVLNEWE